MDPEKPKPLKGIPAFMPAKDSNGYWREKMANVMEDDVIVHFDMEKNCFQIVKKP